MLLHYLSCPLVILVYITLLEGIVVNSLFHTVLKLYDVHIYFIVFLCNDLFFFIIWSIIGRVAAGGGSRCDVKLFEFIHF